MSVRIRSILSCAIVASRISRCRANGGCSHERRKRLALAAGHHCGDRLDQFTKLLVVHHMKLYGTIHVLPVLDFSLRYNRGAAFSFLEGASGWQRWFFTALALVVGAAILIWMRRLQASAQWLLSA
jgi:lipoprotein signal peptidase